MGGSGGIVGDVVGVVGDVISPVSNLLFGEAPMPASISLPDTEAPALENNEEAKAYAKEQERARRLASERSGKASTILTEQETLADSAVLGKSAMMGE